MEPKYKLTYFNGRGLAEISRLIFAYAEVEYIDERIEVEEWAKMKEFMFMRLPILTCNGVKIRESRAIARFLAREFDLAGKNNIEAAECDMLVDEFYDIYPELSKWRSENVWGKEKKVVKGQFIHHIYSEFLRRFSFLLHSKRKPGQSLHFVGEKLTWTDIVLAYGFADLMKIMECHIKPEFYDTPGRRLIIEFVEQILSIPSIKAWIEKRPKSDF